VNDHIPDVTKMIGDTPRTDAEAFLPHDSKHRVCDADFTRQLERELNAANERIKNLESALSTVENIDKVNAYQGLESANERINWLDEELERTKQDRNAIAKNTREPLLLKLDHAAERIKRLESENDALRADLLLWENGGPLP